MLLGSILELIVIENLIICFPRFEFCSSTPESILHSFPFCNLHKISDRPNSSMRDMLARLNRKTKRFSKSLEMLRLTLVMFFNKDIAYSVYDY